MKTIKIASLWTHHTMEVTTDFHPGEHEVSDEIYAAAVKAGAHKEEANGNGAATPGAPRSARKA